MVQPLLEDFLNGKSGMLAALGPSGSGKTHTVFGTPKDPGVVPLTLRQIFKKRDETSSPVSLRYKRPKLCLGVGTLCSLFHYISLLLSSGHFTCRYLRYAPSEGKGRKLMIYLEMEALSCLCSNQPSGV